MPGERKTGNEGSGGSRLEWCAGNEELGRGRGKADLDGEGSGMAKPQWFPRSRCRVLIGHLGFGATWKILSRPIGTGIVIPGQARWGRGSGERVHPCPCTRPGTRGWDWSIPAWAPESAVG